MAEAFKTCQNLGDLPVDQRLNYVFGQVLGVQEFRQEQVYFINKNRLHNRGLHGYGTVWGLPVTLDGAGDEREVQVGAGLAVDQCGQEIEVPALQCARINPWLLAAAPDQAEAETRNADLLTLVEDRRTALYVVLCYSECLTGDQPVFGEPCRSESEAIQPTRIKDDFHLDLRPTSPVQVEEEMVRAFGSLLGRIAFGPDALSPTPEELATLRDALHAAVDQLPTQDETLFELPPAQARALLRDMFRHWVVTKRPALQPSEHPCILLGAIRFRLADDGRVDEAAPIAVDETQRPYLLHTRLLQEWLLAARGTKGEQGEPGPPGADGISVTSASAESVPPEAEAEATFDPETGNLHLKIPRGEKGDPGDGGGAGVTSASAESVAPNASAEAAFDAGTGNVHFKIPRGQQGTAGTPGKDGVSVTSASAESVPSSANAEATFNSTTGNIHFKIPRGEQGPPGQGGGEGARQIIINPNMMVARPTPNLAPPRLNLINEAYPGWSFTVQGQRIVFSWGRPDGMDDKQALGLRIFWSANTEQRDIKASWAVEWRWVGALQFGEAPRPPQTSLDKLFPADPPRMDIFAQQFSQRQLYVTDFFRIEPAQGELPVGDYLAVRITLENGGEFPDELGISLLLVELRW